MEYDSGTMILGIVINLIITAAFYMGPLMIYRFAIYKKAIPRNLARKVCIISGIVMFLILFVVYAATNTDGGPNMMADVLYTTIAYYIIREKIGGVERKGTLEDQIFACKDHYQKLYRAKNPDATDEEMEAINNCFGIMIPYIKMLPMDELENEMKKQKINVDEVTLNVIQNYVMLDAQEKIGPDVIFGISAEAEADIAIYRYVNGIKREKKYISETQYNENERLITAIRYNAPFF